MLAEIACIVLLFAVVVLLQVHMATADELGEVRRENEALTERIEELATVADLYDELRIGVACLDEDHGADLVNEDEHVSEEE